MKKTIIFLIFMLVLLAVPIFADNCNETWIMDGNVNSSYNWSITRQCSILNNDSTAGISITLFLLLVVGSLFYLGIREKPLTKTAISNLILKRAAIVVALYLMVMNMSIIMTITKGTFNIMPELSRYIFFFGYASYIAMAYMVIKTLLDVLKLWNINKRNKRTGEEEDED